MSDEWDGEVVMSTPGGPIVTMSLGDLLARKDAEIERLRAEIERLRERLLQERAALVLDEIGAALERERVLRAALTDMLSGWRYIRETYGDLAGIGWDRAEQKAREALEGKP